jgi:transcriptional regulator with XRE-family HTH domain
MNEKIAKIRQVLGLNQTQFAEKLGLTSANISSIERGKSKLTEQNIHLICLTFGVREEWLRDGKGEMLDDEALLSEYEKRLLDLFRRLSPIAQKLFIEYAQKLLADEQALRGEPLDASKQAPGGPTQPLEAPQGDKGKESTGIGPDPRKSGDTG